MTATTLIEHYEVPAGGVSQINLTSIPNTYTHLELLISMRTTYGTTAATFGLHLNGSSLNYESAVMQGSSSVGLVAFYVTNRPYHFFVNGNSSYANGFSNNRIMLRDYLASRSKTIQVESVYGDSGAPVTRVAGRWNDNTAISSINIIPDSATTIVAGSTVTLFGILDGSSGGVVVS